MDNLSIENYPYLSRRLPVLAARGMVATSEPLAARAGLSVLERGGNAVDAAIAAAAALTVLEPTCNGVGGDALALIWDGGRLHGLNGSGRAPAAHTRELFAGLGLDHVPPRGWLPVTVPGAPAAWAEMHRRFGRMPFEPLFEAAIHYATHGFPVSPITAQRWQAAAAIHAASAGDDPSVRGWRETFTRGGRAPGPGDVWAVPDLATTLRELASTGCESFYRGRLAERIADFAAATGGHVVRRDLAVHESSWVDPISVEYRDHRLWEMPPNSQGVAALTALKVLGELDLARRPRGSAESYHLQIEAIKLGLSDAFRHVADADLAPFPWDQRLTREYGVEAAARIEGAARGELSGIAPRGDTVYLCTADADGLMVSLIQSNFSGWLLGFGSGVVVPGTGVALHSRGCGFTLERHHPNELAPGKRPFHTLCPAFLTRDGKAIGPFGIIGGPLQPQAHVQFVVNQVDYGLNAQATIDAPRFQWISGSRIEVEPSMPGDVIQSLLARGHEVRPCVEFAATPPRLTGAALGSGGLKESGDFGKAQMIHRLANGVYVGASDWRAGGCAIGW